MGKSAFSCPIVMLVLMWGVSYRSQSTLKQYKMTNIEMCSPKTDLEKLGHLKYMNRYVPVTY